MPSLPAPEPELGVRAWVCAGAFLLPCLEDFFVFVVFTPRVLGGGRWCRSAGGRSSARGGHCSGGSALMCRSRRGAGRDAVATAPTRRVEGLRVRVLRLGAGVGVGVDVCGGGGDCSIVGAF